MSGGKSGKTSSKSSTSSGTNDSVVKKMKGESQQQQQQQQKKHLVQEKKASPVKKFFSSIRVVVFLVFLAFAYAFCTIVGAVTMFEIRKVYEKMDTLDMKEGIQNAASGFYQGIISILSRASMLYTDFAYYPYFDNDTLADIPRTEAYLASVIYYGEEVVTEASGLSEYDNLPFHLIMAWDQDWNERLAYYRPCRDPKNRAKCDLLTPAEAFADVEKGDMTLVHKDKIPSFFRKLNETKPYCVAANDVYNCTGIANIPMEEGGPMIFSLFNVGEYSLQMQAFGVWYPFDNWTFLVASNALLFNQIEANRTGMCTSFYSSTEEGLSEYIEKEFETKKEKGLALNPTDIKTDPVTYASVIGIDTGEVTLEQDYYADKSGKYDRVRSDRSYCDAYYDHGDEDYVSMTTACLAYKTFSFEKGQTDDETVAFRFEYHAPLTKIHVGFATIIVSVLCVIFVVAVACVFVYFNCVFLLPLDHLRKMRTELIKNTLSGLEDDGLVAKDLLGEMIDDSALLEANGDEITVMLKLQERLDALYSNIIQSKVDEVNHARAVTRSELCSMRIMNLFMRRDDKSLRAILPGLIDPGDVARRGRGGNLGHTREGEMINRIVYSKRAFRSLKSVLSNSIATQFFKAFCVKRGRSSINSFFFLMDVSWLHQAEDGDRSDQDDFLSAMFSDSVSPSPAMTPRSPALSIARSKDDLSYSSDALPSSSDLLPPPEPDRPHHSHFARRDSVPSNSTGSTTSPGSSPEPKRKVEEEEEAKKTPRIPMMPAGKNPPGSTSPGKLVNAPVFSSKISEGIAHFIHESYFGHRSLARRDMRHAALLGCSQVPDYVNLRDQPNITFTPIMFDNLVTAVTKKFTSEVLPEFLNSVSFQVMVYALMITGFFEDHDEQKAEDKEAMPLLLEDDLIKGIWQACVDPNRKKNEEEDDNSESDSDSDDDDEKVAPSKKEDKSVDETATKTESIKPKEDDTVSKSESVKPKENDTASKSESIKPKEDDTTSKSESKKTEEEETASKTESKKPEEDTSSKPDDDDDESSSSSSSSSDDDDDDDKE